MNIRSLLIVFFPVTFLLLCVDTVESQVVVEKSKDKVVISGKPYYIHQVKKGETAYSISKAYGITVEELTKENPNSVYGVKTGQSLQIPVIDSVSESVKLAPTVPQTQRDEIKYIYHKLNPGETVYSLSKKFGVSENEIILSNPKIDINKMPVGAEIAIPRREFMSEKQKFEDQEFKQYFHKVVKGESLSSIAEKYGTTVRELRKENRGLLFPRVDDYIRIPGMEPAEKPVIEPLKIDTSTVLVEERVVKPEKPVGFTPVKDLKGSFDLAVLLPFYLDENSIRTEHDSSKTIKGKKMIKSTKRPEEWIFSPLGMGFIELYEGVLVAADTLRSLGLDVNLHVYDIKSDTIEISRLISEGKLDEMDLIIGPIYSNNLSIVASYANSRRIPVVSPVPLRNNSVLTNNPTLFMANSSLEVAQEILAKKISEYYNYNFVFIHTDSTGVDPEVAAFKSRIITDLNNKLPFEEIKFKELFFYSRSAFDNDSINRLGHALSDQAKNIIIIASEDPAVMSETITDAYTLSKKFDLKVFGYPAMRGLLDNLEVKYFFDLGIMLYTPYWIDYSKDNVIRFNLNFRQKFLTEPSELSFAWQGFDLTYYFLSGLALHGSNFISNPEIHNPDLLQTTYDFKRKGLTDGFENQKLFFIEYTNDMDIKLIDDKDPSDRNF
jgi:LysM repeat protein